ncbi:MAG TPA: serine hydrolase domain-containing protein [Chitinophagaceae bacterium]|nr:serine hydrolase domain-containing protein [Chitinophagaceae bacterium]
MKQFNIILFCLMHFSLLACDEEKKVFGDSLEKKLDSLVPLILKEYKVPGVSLAVIRDGKVLWTKGYGMADKEKNIPVSSLTRFNIGSVSKTFTAFAVLMLSERGMINIDSPIHKYLKRWQLPFSKFDNKKVTIRRVLSHTAGLSVAGYHGIYKPGDILPTLVQSLSGYEGSDGALYVMQEPGTLLRYSSGGYTLLQMMIEDVTGKPFSQFMQKEIFDPLGMSNTSYDWSIIKSKVATPYDEKGNAWPQYQYVEQGSGGVYTTAADLATFVSLLVTKKQPEKNLLKAETIRQMITAAEATNGFYGLGVKMFPVSKNELLVSHDGANEGWRANYLLHPQKGDGVILLANSDMGGRTGAPIFCTIFSFTKVDMSPLCSTIKY